MSDFWNKGRELLKTTMASAFHDTGLIELLARARRARTGPRVHVLAYHRVVEELIFDGPVNPSLCITTASLAAQLRQVRERFQVLSLADAMRAISGELALERDACAVTFDDGYHDVFARALPILSELGIPGAVFVPTGHSLSQDFLDHDRLYAAFHRLLRAHSTRPPIPPMLRQSFEDAERIGRDHGPAAAVELLIARLPARSLGKIADALETLLGAPDLDRGARVMTPAEVLALSEAGWEIGAHTIDHVVLTHERKERVAAELARPRLDIERFTGRPCRFFAYCNGYHSPELVRAVRAAGYDGAVTTFDRANQPGSDVFRVSRKCLWEAHTRGSDGKFSAAVSAAHLHDLFGDLGLTRPVDGEVTTATHDREVLSCAT